MSEFTAILRFGKLSPQKARLVANAVRGKNVNEALSILTFIEKKPAGVIGKLINSALANAVDREEKINVDSLYLKEIQVNGAKPWKRGLARARGRVTPLIKRLSHISVVLASKN